MVETSHHHWLQYSLFPLFTFDCNSCHAILLQWLTPGAISAGLLRILAQRRLLMLLCVREISTEGFNVLPLLCDQWKPDSFLTRSYSTGGVLSPLRNSNLPFRSYLCTCSSLAVSNIPPLQFCNCRVQWPPHSVTLLPYLPCPLLPVRDTYYKCCFNPDVLHVNSSPSLHASTWDPVLEISDISQL